MKTTGIIILLLGQCILLQAQVMSIDSVLSKIEKNNPELQMYDAQASAYDSYAKGAKAWEAPQLGAGFFMTPYNPSLWKADNSGNGMNGNTYNGMGAFMIQGQQMIPNPAKQKANQQYMQSMSAVEKANKDFQRNSLFAKAKNDYYEWMILQKKMRVLDEQELLTNYLIKTAEVRYPYGQGKLNSIYKAKAALVEVQNMRLLFESQMYWKRASLNQVMNQDASIRFDVDTNSVIRNYEQVTVDTNALTSNRSDVIALDKSILVSRNKQQYENSRLKPDFGIQYGHMFSLGNNPNLFTLMGMVSIPIVPWSSKQYKSTSKGLDYQIQGYQRQREAILNEATAQVASIKYRISAQKQQVSLYEKTMIPALEKNYKVSLLGYEQNTEDLFVVLDAIEALQLSKMELLNKKQELLFLQVEYEKIIEQK